MTIKSINTYHLVFYTSAKKPAITSPGDKILYKSIWEILKTKDCQLFRINGTVDHFHMLMELSPIVPLSAIIKEIETNSTKLIEESHIFPNFEGWSTEILAFSTSYKDREKLIEFIRDQPKYHEKHSTEEERSIMLKSHGFID